jgi:hypothetical protein
MEDPGLRSFGITSCFFTEELQPIKSTEQHLNACIGSHNQADGCQAMASAGAAEVTDPESGRKMEFPL